MRWDVFEKRGARWLSFDWSEARSLVQDSCGPKRPGFGSELIEDRVKPGGAHCHLEFPLKDAVSILETDAPKRATVFGGAIDMSRHADLRGQRILVVEDDYYLATDVARALKGAGADVIGPCATEAAARESLVNASVTCAVFDINLQGGRSFDLAREFHSDHVPLVFITGYDRQVIPEDLQDIRRLQKPVQLNDIVETLAEILTIDR